MICITIAVLSMFGVMAYYIAMEYGSESEKHTLDSMVEEKALQLAGQLDGKSGTATINKALDRLTNAMSLPLLLLDKQSNIIASIPAIRASNYQIIQNYFAGLPPDQRHGNIAFTQVQAMWVQAPVPGTDFRLTLLHGKELDIGLIDALGERLFFAALAVIAITALATWFIARLIGRRLEEQNALLIHQSLHDGLTGLPNRIQLYEHLHNAIQHTRGKNEAAALFLIELTSLKEINDTLGHHNGDELLKQVGPRLHAALRSEDIVVRLDGSEFAILSTIANRKNTNRIARKIHQALERPFQVEELMLETGAAIGMALYPDHGDSPEALLRQADVAMCQSRIHAGEFTVYAEENDPHNVSQLTLMTELRHAIEHDELQLFFQPKIDIGSKQVVGAEALLRWIHPQRGMILPMDFIPKAEHTSLIKPLTHWVITQAIQQGCVWAEMNLPLQIAINVSQRSLYDHDLINQIANTMQKCQLQSCCLDIEITETALMSNPEQSLATLHMLNDMGIRLSIDDFGTGFTSLAYLRELPIDELKIDKSFVMRMQDDSRDVMIVRTIIELAHSLGRSVVAEGVESEEAFGLLQSLRCDTAQGFYFAKPMPAEEFGQWLVKSPWKPASRQVGAA